MSKGISSRLRYFYQAEKVISVSQDDQHRTVFRNEKAPLAELKSDAPGANLIATDNLKSVLQVKSTQEFEAYGYTAYGYTLALPSTRTLLGFSGELLNSSGFYLLGAGHRAYNPVLMRLLSPDSLSPFTQGGINSYAYCSGDPVNFTDPSGRWRIRAFTSAPKSPKYVPRVEPVRSPPPDYASAVSLKAPKYKKDPPSYKKTLETYSAEVKKAIDLQIENLYEHKIKFDVYIDVQQKKATDSWNKYDAYKMQTYSSTPGSANWRVNKKRASREFDQASYYQDKTRYFEMKRDRISDSIENLRRSI